MLFNSLVFLLVFLPAAILLDTAVERWWPAWRPAALLLTSLLFYASFDLRFVPFLLVSIGLNWAVGRSFQQGHHALLIALAIGLNLGILGLFKYLDFLADLADVIPGVSLPHADLAFPLGISFFTFQHVAYLVDLKRDKVGPAGLLGYALYIAFFPKLVAGPLIRAGDFLPQIVGRCPAAHGGAERAAHGLLLLIAGLSKKVLLGDPLGAIVDPIYAAAATGVVPGLGQAWEATLGYTFQLYFDFSGYSDMAIGIALLFGITLPQNFDAPYRSVSIQDFWRRWHITLSFFLRDYLYISFGGNRHGLSRQVAALFATMAIGGLWHGAGLTFVAWGAAHGAALGLQLLWRRAGRTMPDWVGWGLTFAFVALSWVLFRAPSFAAALAVYEGLLGMAAPGTSPAWPMLAAAGAAAVLGPTSWSLVRRLPPSRWVAIAAAIVAVGILLKVGNDSNAEFIYAQF